MSADACEGLPESRCKQQGHTVIPVTLLRAKVVLCSGRNSVQSCSLLHRPRHASKVCVGLLGKWQGSFMLMLSGAGTAI